MAPTGPMPAWLVRHLVGNGTLSEGGVTDRAKVMRHRPCHRTVIGGWDPYMEAICDPHDMSAAGELAAVLHGLRTYVLDNPHLPERMVLRPRIYSYWDHLPPPGPGNDLVVLSAHRCGLFVPESWKLHRPPPEQAVAPHSYNEQRKPQYVSLDNWIQFGF